MQEQVIELATYGPMGVLTIAACAALVVVWRQLVRERRERTEELSKERKLHQQEMQALLEQHTRSLETGTKKMTDLVQAVTAALDAIARRFQR